MHGDWRQPEFHEIDLVKVLAHRLRQDAWEVAEQPLLGGLYRPDLVLRRGDLPPIAVEVKVDRGLIHFGSVTQASAYRSAMTATGHPGGKAVLLSTGRATESVRNVAERMGVLLFSIPGRTAEEIAEIFVRELAERIQREG